jgi:hypothetical protein
MMGFGERDRAIEASLLQGESQDRSHEVLSTLDEETVIDLAVDAYWRIFQRFLAVEEPGPAVASPANMG